MTKMYKSHVYVSVDNKSVKKKADSYRISGQTLTDRLSQKSSDQVTKFNHGVLQRITLHCNFFTGAVCQKPSVQYSPTDVPEMPPCNFKPEEYEVRATSSRCPVHLATAE